MDDSRISRALYEAAQLPADLGDQTTVAHAVVRRRRTGRQATALMGVAALTAVGGAMLASLPSSEPQPSISAAQPVLYERQAKDGTRVAVVERLSSGAIVTEVDGIRYLASATGSSSPGHESWPGVGDANATITGATLTEAHGTKRVVVVVHAELGTTLALFASDGTELDRTIVDWQQLGVLTARIDERPLDDPFLLRAGRDVRRTSEFTFDPFIQIPFECSTNTAVVTTTPHGDAEPAEQPTRIPTGPTPPLVAECP